VRTPRFFAASLVGSQRVDLRALIDDVVARLAEAAPTPGVTVRSRGRVASRARRQAAPGSVNLIKTRLSAAPAGRVEIHVGEPRACLSSG